MNGFSLFRTIVSAFLGVLAFLAIYLWDEVGDVRGENANVKSDVRVQAEQIHGLQKTLERMEYDIRVIRERVEE